MTTCADVTGQLQCIARLVGGDLSAVRTCITGSMSQVCTPSPYNSVPSFLFTSLWNGLLTVTDRFAPVRIVMLSRLLPWVLFAMVSVAAAAMMAGMVAGPVGCKLGVEAICGMGFGKRPGFWVQIVFIFALAMIILLSYIRSLVLGR